MKVHTLYTPAGFYTVSPVWFGSTYMWVLEYREIGSSVSVRLTSLGTLASERHTIPLWRGAMDGAAKHARSLKLRIHNLTPRKTQPQP